MRDILVPTDFSEVSKNAFKYGLALYRRTESKIDVVHIYHPVFDPSQNEIIDLDSAINKLLKERMSDFLSARSMYDIEVSGRIEMGFAVEKIVKLSFNYDIIIMGTTGESGLLGQVFGKVSSDVATQAHCPVLLIPPGIEFDGYKNIIYSCDFDGVNDAILREIASFAKRYNAKLHFVHIKKGDEEFHLNIPDDIGLDYTINQIEADSVIDGVNSFIENNSAELVIMAAKKRSFWERIVHKNHTKEFALNVKIPLLIYHETKRK